MENICQKLDLQSLNSEYTKWIFENGMGRNSNDQRFGQYIHNNYDLSSLIEGKSNDGFYEEEPHHALVIITNLISKK